MQLSPQTIRALSSNINHYPLISPIRAEYRHEESGLSGGLSCAGYDVHMTDELIGIPAFSHQPVRYPVGENGPIWALPPRTGCLAVTEEKFCLPDTVAMHYYNKSSLARRFMNACATLGEPGWHGHLTLELYNQTDKEFLLYPGQPIGQVIFIQLDKRSVQPYKGKYQNQGSRPEQAR